jgi:hypothetical protein
MEVVDTIDKRMHKRHDRFNVNFEAKHTKLDDNGDIIIPDEPVREPIYKNPIYGTKVYISYQVLNIKCVNHLNATIPLDFAKLLGKKVVVWAKPTVFNFVSTFSHNAGQRVQGWNLRASKIQLSGDWT